MFSNEAFARTAERYMDTIYRVAYGWLKNPDDANDVTQDVLIELLREYWIIDPAKEKVVLYCYDHNSDPCLYSFDSDIPVGIYQRLMIRIRELL